MVQYYVVMSVVCADRGLLYTCGDGLHGKLALGDDNIANHFKPTLVTRFAKFIVESVSYLSVRSGIWPIPAGVGAELTHCGGGTGSGGGR